MTRCGETLSARDWNVMLEAQANLLFEKAQQAISRPRQQAGNRRTGGRAGEQRPNKCCKRPASIPLMAIWQTPTAENVDYLWRHGLSDIVPVRRDIPTRSGDTFTEYVVRKKNKNRQCGMPTFTTQKKAGRVMTSGRRT